MHPSWYYRYFEKVFDRGQAYTVEAEFLRKQLGSLRGTVVEVGAGTGQHAAALLQLGVQRIVLIDKDPSAIDILMSRFAHDERVVVECADGFGYRTKPWCDRIFAMYSLVQQAREKSELIDRIRSLVCQVRKGGSIAFEAIDVERSKDVYPSGQSSRIYEGEDGWMDITSTYSEGEIRISYVGELNSEVCRYSVRLVGSEVAWLEQILEKTGVRIRERQALDPRGRRVLLGGVVT